MNVIYKKRTEIMPPVLTNYTLPGVMRMLFVIWKEREKLHNYEPDCLHSSPNNIPVIKSRAGHVANMGKNRNAYRVSLKSPKKRDRLEDLVVDGRIILKRP